MQKNQNHKISHVTYIINTEKEKFKNKVISANAKFIKGRKKGNLNKKEEENEINPYSNASIKLKNIYRILSSKKMDGSIIKMILYSIIIFILVLGTGMLNIIIYYQLKNSTYSFFTLIRKSDNLYQNLLFEISIVKEMLIINYSYYNNLLTGDKELYYQSLTRMIFQYYSDNAFIISNITNNFNILSKEDEESIILVYSAYPELNAALYHISQLKMKEIYHYDEDIYYFLRNGMSNLLLTSQNQMWTLTEKLEEKINYGHKTIIICCISIFLVYCICIFILIYFYNNITKNKQNYLNILKEIDINLIISSLQKCERLNQKLQEKKENKEIKKGKINFEYSSEDYSEKENENSVFLIDKNNKIDKISLVKNDKKENKKNSKKIYVIYFISVYFTFCFFYLANSDICLLLSKNDPL